MASLHTRDSHCAKRHNVCSSITSVRSRQDEAGKFMNPPRTVVLRVVFLSLLLGGGIFWAYFPVFREMTSKWLHNPQYSHAYVIPAFSAYLLWKSREAISRGVTGP